MIGISTSTDVRSLLGALGAALAAGRREDVGALIGRLIAINAPIGSQWRAIAQVCRRDGELDRARTAMGRYVRSSGNAPMARFEEAALLADIGDIDTARRHLSQLPADVPDAATHAHFAGTLALNGGDVDAAIRHFGIALRHRPGSGQTWLSYTDAVRTQAPDCWTSDILDARQHFVAAAPAERAPFLYAVGAAYHSMGDHDRAFAAFDEGARIARTLRSDDRKADHQLAAQARAIKTITARPSTATARPIFVFGPPRSGTTLVEHILASHSMVVGGGEIQLFDMVVRDLGGLSSEHLNRAIAGCGVDALTGRYLHLLDQRFGPNGRVVDKTLTVTRYAHLVASLLPDAPLIWIRRDPLDCAWSCFRTHFNQGLAWSFDQTALADHLLIEADLLAFWEDVLGDRLLVVNYSALTANAAVEIRRIMTHCGLAPEPAVFEPQKTRRTVITASVTQVRQPINRKGIGVADPYRRHLEPFIAAYGYKG